MTAPENPITATQIVTLMAKADDMIEAQLFLLTVNPMSTPELTNVMVEAVHRSADLTGDPPLAYETTTAVLLATALQKISTERWSR